MTAVPDRLTIATRRSPLAMAQALWVRDALARVLGFDEQEAEARIVLQPRVTTGDKDLRSSLAAIGGKGLFTKEIEAALLTRDADIAVHSMKDMPAAGPDGLTIAAVPEREDPRDALVTPSGVALTDVPQGAKIGTSSVRRTAQLRRLRPDLELTPLRGNVATRLAAVTGGGLDGTLLAQAGLSRLGHTDVRRTPLSPDEMLPALGQGALAVQCRADDEAVLTVLAKLNHGPSSLTNAAERAVVAALEGTCRTPIAGLARMEGETLTLEAELLSLDGAQRFAAKREGHPATVLEAAEIGRLAAEDIISQAGDDLTSLLNAADG